MVHMITMLTSKAYIDIGEYKNPFKNLASWQINLSKNDIKWEKIKNNRQLNKKTSLHLISAVSVDITSEHHFLLRNQSHKIFCLFVPGHNKMK